jgi:protein-tyrosine phosphatase
MAEQMLSVQLQRLGKTNIKISSAGTMAMSGHGIDESIFNAMQELSLAPRKHSARQLTKEMIEEADLVLTATTSHRSDVVELVIPANRYSFTLKEFASLAKYVVESGAKDIAENEEQLLADTKLLRGYGLALDNQDIADPYRLGPDAARTSALETAEAIEWVARWLV